MDKFHKQVQQFQILQRVGNKRGGGARWLCQIARQTEDSRARWEPLQGAGLTGPACLLCITCDGRCSDNALQRVVRAGGHLQTSCAVDEGEKGKRRGFKGCYLLRTLICDFMHTTPTTL